jgi:uncharacterized protein (TIRG00374 family)
MISLDLGFISLSITFVLVSHLINVYRWRFILNAESPGFIYLLRVYGAGLFSNNFLPTGVGGDGVRAALLARSVSLSRAILSVGFDRGIGLIALSGLFALGIMFGAPPVLRSQIVLSTFDLNRVDSVGVWIVLVCLGLVGLFLGVSILVSRVNPQTFRQWLSNNASFHQPSHWVRLLLGGYAISFLSHLFLVAANWAVLRSLDLSSIPGMSIWLVLASALTLLTPIAINGLGLQESVYVLLLSSSGVPVVTAIGVAIIVRTLMVLSSLIGGIIGFYDGYFSPKEALT